MSSRRGLIALWSGAIFVLAAAIGLSWNETPFWMDAGIYARAVAEGRWAAHPPGYLLFVAAGRLLHAAGVRDAYRALQILTLLCTLGGVLLLYRLLREVVGVLQSSILAAAFALSWVPLLMNHTGTSHAADFVTAPLMLLAASRLTGRPGRAASVFFALAIVLCGGSRLTTLVMMSPLLLAVLWVNRRSFHVWSGFAVGVMTVGLLQLLVVRATGGWTFYRYLSEKTNFENRTYSLLYSGLTWPVVLNVGRAVLWTILATAGLAFGLFSLRSGQPWTAKQRLLLTYGLLALGGPAAVWILYLCEHPGYVAPALAGFYLCVAVAWDRAGGRLGFARWPAAGIVVSLVLFLGLRYHREPRTRGQAIANGVLLQYSADGARNACYFTPFTWVRRLPP